MKYMKLIAAAVLIVAGALLAQPTLITTGAAEAVRAVNELQGEANE